MTVFTPFDVLKLLYPATLRPGQLVLWSKIRASGRELADWCCTAHQAARRAETFRRTRDVFFGVALRDRVRALARARRDDRRATPSRVLGGADLRCELIRQLAYLLL